MNVYVVRFHDPKHGSVFMETVAGTEADAREDCEKLHPDCQIISAHVKPFKTKWSDEK